jgi:hypothetical protein
MKLKKILKAILKERLPQMSPEEREQVFSIFPKWRTRYGYDEADDGRARDRALLVKTLRMLGSAHEGERANAALAAERCRANLRQIVERFDRIGVIPAHSAQRAQWRHDHFANKRQTRQ